ncbi:hypothetical protein ACO2Q7_07990 [Rathayibacter sp. KR2-224]|uniref:hypothetical protein n=1 Tax=Rathayibacter sp. KR2-224 TaxID=3400913 RepID=UPI003BFDD0E7
MSNEISRRSILTAAAATAGIAATNAFIWTPAAARAEPVTGLHAVGGKPSLNEPLDTVVFGDAASEQAHAFSASLSDVVAGALSQPARVFNPQATPGWWGGSAALTVKVDPTQTTYLTVKLWGGDVADKADESHNWRLQLFVDGKSVGWYDEGPVDNLDQLGTDPRRPGRFFFHTLPLPERYTNGKTSLDIEIRSMGRIWDYGGTVSTYYYNQTEPSRPVYRVYTHTDPYFSPAPTDVLGTVPATKARPNEDDAAIAKLTASVLAEHNRLIYGGGAYGTDAWGFNMLAEAYTWKASPGYQNPDALTAICAGIDSRYNAWKADPTVLTGSDQQWQGFGRVGLVLSYLWEDIQDELDKTVTTGPTTVANPGFELGTAGWNTATWLGSGTVSTDTTVAHSGSASLKIVANPNGTAGSAVGVTIAGRPLVGTGTYSFGVWCKTDSVSAPGPFLDILFYNDAGQIVKSDQKFYGPTGTHDWQQITAALPVPSGATKVRIDLRVQGTGTAWFDDVSMRLVTGTPPAPAGLPGRRAAYTDMLLSSRDYWKQNMRHYSNQAQITAIGIYQANRGLSLISPKDSWPESRAREWIYESIGLKPWYGPELPDGTRTKPLGTDYYVVTPKGLTRELGYVGSYGEVTDWLVMMYESITRGFGAVPAPEVRAQMVKMVQARGYFRQFDADADGYRVARLETVVGWRNEQYPGVIVYASRTVWDCSPVMAAAAFGDPKLTGWTQEMFDDGQFAPQLDLMFTNTSNRVQLNATRMLARDLDAYRALPVSSERMPVDWDAPDFVFTDEVDGVLAVKNGQELFFASLYWRARQGVNSWGRVHLLSPSAEQSATVRQKTGGALSSSTFTVQDWVNQDYTINDSNGGSNFPLGGITPPGDTVHQAYAGEVLPLAIIPSDAHPALGSTELGVEEALVGIAPYYELRYGRYLVGMNTTIDQIFTVKVTGLGTARLLSTPPHGFHGNTEHVAVASGIAVPPQSTVVLYLD